MEEDSGPNGVTTEFDMQWDGVVLDIKTKVGVVIPVQVESHSITGVPALKLSQYIRGHMKKQHWMLLEFSRSDGI